MKKKFLVAVSLVIGFGFCFCDRVFADSYSECINASGGRGGIESVQWACKAYNPWNSNQACTLWIGGSDSSGTTINVDSDEGSATVYYWGMCTIGTNTTSSIWVENDNDSIDSSGNLTRGTWGSPNYMSTTLNIAKFISGASSYEVSSGTAYYRNINLCRQHGGNTSTSCQGVSLTVIVKNQYSYFEGYSKGTFDGRVADTGWRSGGQTTASLAIPCTNQYGKCSVSFSHGARRTSGESNGDYLIDRSNSSSWGSGTNAVSGTFGYYTMSETRSAEITVGSTICDRNRFSTIVKSSTGEVSSARTQACISAPYNFDNNISVEMPDEVFAGETAQIKINAWVEDLYNSSIGESFHTVANATVVWSVRVDGATYSSTTESLNRYMNYEKSEVINMPDVRAGSEVCVVATISPASSNNSGALSAQDCAIVAKKPTFQVLGGGVYSSGDISSLLMDKHNLAGESYSLNGGTQKVFGSWSELMVVGGGGIKNFASGATLANGGSLGNTLCSYSPLTLANANCNNLGRAGVVKGSGYVDNLLAVLEDNDTVDLIHTSEITNNIESSRQTVIYSDGDLNIHCGVSRIDAILIANGTIDTCSDVADKNASGRSNQLTINGFVVAKKLVLGRTYGAGTGNNSNVPAEIINAGTGFYLWGINNSESSDQLYTTYLREVSPRY